MIFREARRSREDPEVLAAQSEEQYVKVLENIGWLFFFVRRRRYFTLFKCGIDQKSYFVNSIPNLILVFS